MSLLWWDLPTYVKCPEKASLSATSYPIQPTRLPSEQQSAREHHREHTIWRPTKASSINQSISQSIIKCIHAHPVTKVLFQNNTIHLKICKVFFSLWQKKQPDHGPLRRIMTIRVAGIVGLLDGYHCDKQDDNVTFRDRNCHTADWPPFVHNHSLCSTEQVSSWVSLFGILVCSALGITNVTTQSMVF